MAGLFLALLLQTAFAQRRLSPALLPYAENWTYTMVNAMHRAGFDMPTLSSSTNIDDGTLQLDSTKTFFEYDLIAPGDSTPLFRTVYQYPMPDSRTETNYQYTNGQWERINRSTLLRDGKDRLVEVIAETFDAQSQSFVPDSRLEIFPHGDSPELVDSFFTYLWDSTLLDWTIVLANRNQFDANNKLLESSNALNTPGTPLLFKEVYSYDTNGDNHLIEEFSIIGGDELPASRTEIKYVDHRPVEVLLHHAESGVLVPQKKTTYAYMNFGSGRRQTDFEWNAPTGHWRIVQSMDYTYDSAERISTLITANNLLETRERIAYTYHSAENLALETLSVWDDALFDWSLDSKKYYHYKGLVAVNPEPLSALKLQVSPNPTTGLVQLELAAPAWIQLYNSNGRLMRSVDYKPGQLLEINELPNGVYFITARTGHAMHTGKVIKQFE